MSEIEENAIHQNNQAVIVLVGTWAKCDVLTHSKLTPLIKNAKQDKKDDGCSSEMLIGDTGLVSDDRYTEGCGKCMLFIDRFSINFWKERAGHGDEWYKAKQYNGAQNCWIFLELLQYFERLTHFFRVCKYVLSWTPTGQKLEKPIFWEDISANLRKQLLKAQKQKVSWKIVMERKADQKSQNTLEVVEVPLIMTTRMMMQL